VPEPEPWVTEEVLEPEPWVTEEVPELDLADNLPSMN
jgi:hypothetical protein